MENDSTVPSRTCHRWSSRSLWTTKKLRRDCPVSWGKPNDYLYVILDIYSHYAVGWMLARAERAELSKKLISESIAKQGVTKDQLTIHSDRGSPMIAKGVAHLLADLEVTKSLSQPHVSNDNPYSQSEFRTFRSRPDLPDRFGSYEDGRAQAIREQRGAVLLDAYGKHPERFVRKTPPPPALPAVAWIKEPEKEAPTH
jgi:putative transposase